MSLESILIAADCKLLVLLQIMKSVEVSFIIPTHVTLREETDIFLVVQATEEIMLRKLLPVCIKRQGLEFIRQI